MKKMIKATLGSGLVCFLFITYMNETVESAGKEVADISFDEHATPTISSVVAIKNATGNDRNNVFEQNDNLTQADRFILSKAKEAIISKPQASGPSQSMPNINQIDTPVTSIPPPQLPVKNVEESKMQDQGVFKSPWS